MRRNLFLSISLAALCTVMAHPASAQEQIDTTGQLRSGDRELSSGEYYDSYTITARSGEMLNIRASSTEFDPYLIVTGPDDVRFENDDESMSSLNAAIYEAAPASGDYQVIVTSYQPGETGAYQLVGSSGATSEPWQAGTLRNGDTTLSSGEFFDSYPIQLRAGETVDLWLSSTEFDPYLILRGPDGEVYENDDAGDGSLNSRIMETVTTGGTYSVIATSYQPGETGAYRLDSTVLDRTMANNRQSGTLAEGDEQLSSGEYVDAFEIEGRAGETLDVRLSSSDFDTYLMLRGPDGSSFDNDDSDGTNSRLEVTLPASGTYRLMVTSYQPGETGNYALTSAGAEMLAVRGGTAGRNYGGGETTALAIGTPTTGTLSADDEQLSAGEYLDLYSLRAAAGTQLTVEMTSTAIDTYLAAFGTGGYEVSNDDDAAAGGTNSRLSVTMPSSGELTIAATSYGPEETGRYTLTATLAGAAARASNSGNSTSLAIGDDVDGALTASDPRGDNSREDSYQLRGNAGQPLHLAVSSTDFDTVLRLEGPNGFVLENDDAVSGITLDSLIETTLPATGNYQVIVSSYEAEGLGSYALTSSATLTGEAGVPGSVLPLGGTIEASLDRGDGTIVSGEYFDLYRFEGRRGQRVTFDMSSGEIDTYLTLQFPSGGQEDNDDRAGLAHGTDSRLTVTLPENGFYQLAATSYAPGETGSYTISARPSTEVPGEIDPRLGSSRVWALSVGVSQYERMNTLDLTDQDALKLTQTLSQTGMLAPESVTLVNAEATRENFEAALESIARQIGPDDLFLLFFSGHGDKVESDPAIERDGSYETIELFDEAITDVELTAMLEQMPGRVLLVLDSCFSGGFDNVVNQQLGRMGVFSSDSDLTSLVADKFEAGGYISHILQLALEGEADANGDRGITAGELSEYMRNTFYRITLDEPLDADVHDAQGERGSGYQHIVINRGGDGMPYEEVLVNLGHGVVQ